MKKNALIESLKKNLPPVIARKEIPKLLGGIISVRSMSNLDSKGKGPEKIRFGKRTVVYEREALISWIEDRLHDVPDAS